MQYTYSKIYIPATKNYAIQKLLSTEMAKNKKKIEVYQAIYSTTLCQMLIIGYT
jgi:hypothetical protein